MAIQLVTIPFVGDIYNVCGQELCLLVNPNTANTTADDCYTFGFICETAMLINSDTSKPQNRIDDMRSLSQVGTFLASALDAAGFIETTESFLIPRDYNKRNRIFFWRHPKPRYS